MTFYFINFPIYPPAEDEIPALSSQSHLGRVDFDAEDEAFAENDSLYSAPNAKRARRWGYVGSIVTRYIRHLTLKGHDGGDMLVV